MSNNNPAQASKRRGLLITSLFDAPGGQLWKAWNDPGQVMRWGAGHVS